MSTLSKKSQFFILFIFSIFLFILFAVIYIYKTKPIIISDKKDLYFEYCNQNIFSRQESFLSNIHYKIDKNDYEVLSINCLDIYPEKRDFLIKQESFSGNFIIPEKSTQREEINIPKGTVLETSTVDIKFSIPIPDVTQDVTFFGYSLGKIQNRDGTTRIGATSQNILEYNFSLDEIYYKGDSDNPELIVTNLLGNTLHVDYSFTYNIQY